MAATAGQPRQDDQRDNLGNHYGSSAEGSAQAQRTGSTLSDIAGTPAARDPTSVSTRAFRNSQAGRQYRFRVNRDIPPPDFDLV